jgi:molybdate transport system regulatory protein
MPTASVRFRVHLGSHAAVGPGKIALLEHINQSGSLAGAARNLKMSYKRAWQLLDSLNRTFTLPVVVTVTGGRGGGGASLTALGDALIDAYRSFDDAIQTRAAGHFGPLMRHLGNSRSPANGATVVRRSPRRKAKKQR